MDAIETYLRDRFGDIDLTPPPSFSGTNQIYLLEGTIPLRVAKIAGLSPDDILNDYHCLQCLEESGLVPRPESLDWVDGVPVLIVEGRPGPNLLELILELNRTEWRETLPYYLSAAGKLARCDPQPAS